jgi:hypothetical protein
MASIRRSTHPPEINGLSFCIPAQGCGHAGCGSVSDIQALFLQRSEGIPETSPDSDPQKPQTVRYLYH